MGQDFSSPSQSVSILAPLDNEEAIDPDLVRSLIALTSESSSFTPMPSVMRSEDDGEELARMRQEAEKDYLQWKAARKLMRLTRHDSSTSTASSGVSFQQSSFC